MDNKDIVEAIVALAKEPLFILMVGPPGCGKSTLSKQLLEVIPAVIVSFELETDKRYGTKETYLHRLVVESIIREDHVIIDRICMTEKARQVQLRYAPWHYVPIAIDLNNVELDELERRVNTRPEAPRRVPRVAIDKIMREYQAPSLLEGFEHILTRR